MENYREWNGTLYNHLQCIPLAIATVANIQYFDAKVTKRPFFLRYGKYNLRYHKKVRKGSSLFAEQDLELSWFDAKISHILSTRQIWGIWYLRPTWLCYSNWIQIFDFSALVTFKFDGWPRKTQDHFYYATWIVHHFIALCEIKLELQSCNAQCGSKSMILCPVWPWNLTDELEKQKVTFSKLLQALWIIS